MLRHRRAARPGVSEVPGEGAAEPLEIAGERWLVEPELLADVRHRLWCRRLPQVGLGKVARQRLDAEVNDQRHARSVDHTSELQSLIRISLAVFCLQKNFNTLTLTLPNTHLKQLHTHTYPLQSLYSLSSTL